MEPTNREQRRAAERGRDVEDVVERQERERSRADTPQDVTDPRAKNEGHGKKTADKWNQ